MPAEYPIPDDGPVGAMLTATKRHPWRPAHLHFMIAAKGHETLVTHIFVQDGPYLDSDAVCRPPSGPLGIETLIRLVREG